MPYDYKVQRPNLFTEDGVKLVIAVRDNVHRLIELAGAVRFLEALKDAPLVDSWDAMAILDYLVERGEIREVTGPDVVGQRRVFVAGGARRD